MDKYGISAITAVKLYNSGRASSPRDAWERATSVSFGSGTASQVKGCPRDAFLGLCEAGHVAGVPTGIYTRSQKNKQYAVAALALLKNDPSLAISLGRLWKQVTQGEAKQHNSQMNVVVALWNNGLIV
jgi:hypothetical protein